MQLAIYHTAISAVRADALFASVMQRSDEPSEDQVRWAIAAAMRAYGDRGCAERVAQEFGNHPETAVWRMRWARAAVDEAFGWPPEPAPDGTRGRPELPVTALGHGGWQADEAHPYRRAEDPALTSMAGGRGAAARNGRCRACPAGSAASAPGMCPSKSATVLTGPRRSPAGGAERWRMRRKWRLPPTLRDAGNRRGMWSGLSASHRLRGGHWGQAMRAPCSGHDWRPSGSGRR
jgi:hypothetical protein